MALEEHEWVRRARRALRSSERELSSATLARLRAARARATAGRRRVTRWPVAAALAAGLAVWLVLPRPALTPAPPPVNVVALDALDVLTDEMGPEFYENLELYRWLEDEAGDRV